MRALPCLLAILTAAPGCSNSGKPILFVLPNDFTGEFSVVKDSAHGAELVEQSVGWVIEIPPSGVLRVKDDRSFYRWHAERARYADGREVSYQHIGTMGGSRPTPHGSEGSTDFDGTTHRYRVTGSGAARPLKD
ncbi:hypothetical protein [Gemmata sp.]|uniref:hypothetical protein n=1 Tax=Gemmata sp. TaxID=1914242 RepID=UPI003F71F2E2